MISSRVTRVAPSADLRNIYGVPSPGRGCTGAPRRLAGAHIRLYPDKSGQRALAGSQNFSVASLVYNRELGILISNAHIVAAMSAALAGDYAGAAPYSPPPPSRSGARCTATASVYDASRDENNVYVHSNQLDQEATATADGYSHGYRTNGSGYALIYLNGPPPAGSAVQIRTCLDPVEQARSG